MSTQPVEHKGYNYNYSQPRKARSDVVFPFGPEQSKKRQDKPVVSGQSSRERIGSLLEEIPSSEENRLSFRDIIDYRDSLEADWRQDVSENLQALGISLSPQFTLTHDPVTGSVSVNGNHPDKARIEQYFQSNEITVATFEKVLQLGKLASVAERTLTPDELTQTFGTEAMAWWYQSHMGGISLYSGGGTVFGTGGVSYKRLDIRV